MTETEDCLRDLSPEEQDEHYRMLYVSFLINSQLGHKANAIDQLRRSSAVANACDFTLERVMSLQDAAQDKLDIVSASLGHF